MTTPEALKAEKETWLNQIAQLEKGERTPTLPDTLSIEDALNFARMRVQIIDALLNGDG